MAYGTNVIVTYGMRSLSYGIISGGFRLPYASGGLDPQVAPTAAPLSELGGRACPPSLSLRRGGRAVYTTHSSVGCLPRDVVSLRV